MTAERKVGFVQADSRGRASIGLEPGRVYRRTTHPDGRIVLEPARLLTAREIEALTGGTIVDPEAHLKIQDEEQRAAMERNDAFVRGSWCSTHREPFPCRPCAALEGA